MDGFLISTVDIGYIPGILVCVYSLELCWLVDRDVSVYSHADDDVH